MPKKGLKSVDIVEQKEDKEITDSLPTVRKKVTYIDRKRVLAMKKLNTANTEIAKELGIHHKTVGRLVRDFQEKGLLESNEPADRIEAPTQEEPEEEPAQTGGKKMDLKINPKDEPIKGKAYVSLDTDTMKVIEDLIKQGIAVDVSDAIRKSAKVTMFASKSGMQETPIEKAEKQSSVSDMMAPLKEMSEVQKVQATMKAMNKMFSDDEGFSLKDLMMYKTLMREDMRPAPGIDPNLLALLKGDSGNSQIMALQNQLNQLQMQLQNRGNQIDPNMLIALAGNKNLPELLGIVEKQRTERDTFNKEMQFELEKMRQDNMKATQEFYKSELEKVKEMVRTAGERQGLEKNVTEKLVGVVSDKIARDLEKGITGEKSGIDVGDLLKSYAPTINAVAQETARAQMDRSRYNQALQDAQRQQQQAQNQRVPDAMKMATPEERKAFDDLARKPTTDFSPFPGEQQNKPNFKQGSYFPGEEPQ